MDRLEQQLRFLKELDKLKDVQRKTMVETGRFETTAEHSWHLAMWVMVFAKDIPDLDVFHTLKMVLVHDIVEIDAGDTFAFDEKGKETKQQREEDAAARLFSILPEDLRDEFVSLWREYDARETREAKFASSFDKLSPLVQNIVSNGKAVKEFKITYEKATSYHGPAMEHDESMKRIYARLMDENVENGYLQ